MARQKKKSDELYNQRRRVRRVISNLEKNIDSFTGVSKEAISRYIGELRNLVEMSYQSNKPKGMSKKEEKRYDERLTKSLANVGQVSKSSRQDRANKIFQREMNLASSGDDETMLGQYGLAKVKIFYKATEDMWLGMPLHKRNEAIMQKLGVNSLEEAMKIVLATQGEALDAAKAYAASGAMSPGEGDGGIKSSYDWMAYVRKL